MVGTIIDELRNRARKHDADKLNGLVKGHPIRSRHHWLFIKPNEVNAIDLLEAIVDNCADYPVYKTHIQFPLNDAKSVKWAWVKRIIVNTIHSIYPDAVVEFVDKR